MPTPERYRALSEEQREAMREHGRSWYRANREKRLEQQRKWREENLERKRQIMKESARRRRAEQPENLRAYQRKRRQNESPEQREKRLAKLAEWPKAHPERKRELRRKSDEKHPGKKSRWRERNPDKARAARLREQERLRERKAEDPQLRARQVAHVQNRRARKTPTPGHHTPADIIALYRAQEGKCAACRKPFPSTGTRRYEVDHIIPLNPRNGGTPGTNGPENLQLLCSACNRSKGNLTPDEWNKRRGI